MEVLLFSEISVAIYQLRRSNNRIDFYLQQHCCENLRSRNTVSVSRPYFIQLKSLLSHNGHWRLWTQY